MNCYLGTCMILKFPDAWILNKLQRIYNLYINENAKQIKCLLKKIYTYVF